MHHLLVTRSIAWLFAMLPLHTLATVDIWMQLEGGFSSNWPRLDYQQQAQEIHPSASIDASQLNRPNYAAGIGINFNPGKLGGVSFGSQLNWFDLGQVGFNYSGQVILAEQQNFNEAMAEIHPRSGKGLQWLLLLNRRPNINNPAYSYSAKIGAAWWQQDYQAAGLSNFTYQVQQKGLGLVLGAQVNYLLSNRFELGLNWQTQQLQSEWSQSLNASLRWHWFSQKKIRKNELLASAQFDPTLYFAPRSAKLPQDLHIIWQDWLKYLRDNPNVGVRIIGHTDLTGDPEFNQWLANLRAQKVHDLLIDAGLEPMRLQALSKAGTEPIASNHEELSRRLNRRVEFEYFLVDEQ